VDELVTEAEAGAPAAMGKETRIVKLVRALPLRAYCGMDFACLPSSERWRILPVQSVQIAWVLMSPFRASRWARATTTGWHRCSSQPR